MGVARVGRGWWKPTGKITMLDGLAGEPLRVWVLPLGGHEHGPCGARGGAPSPPAFVAGLPATGFGAEPQTKGRRRGLLERRRVRLETLLLPSSPPYNRTLSRGGERTRIDDRLVAAAAGIEGGIFGNGWVGVNVVLPRGLET